MHEVSSGTELKPFVGREECVGSEAPNELERNVPGAAIYASQQAPDGTQNEEAAAANYSKVRCFFLLHLGSSMEEVVVGWLVVTAIYWFTVIGISFHK